MLKQAGTGPSRRHIQGSKIAKGLPSVNLQYSKIKKPKNGPSGAPGPASASPWRAKRGDTSEIVNIFVAVEGADPLEKKQNFEKSHSAEKNLKCHPLVSPGMVCYAGKQEKPFWFSSLGQMVQFGAIIFCRTFKNDFGQFVWVEKKKSHYNSRVSLHEAPTKEK